MKFSYTYRRLFTALAFGAFIQNAATAADFTSTWNGTTGDWSDFTKWSTNPTVPNNGGSTFDVVQSAGVLTLDQTATIQKYNLTGSTNTGTGLTLTLNELFTFSGAILNGTGDVNANGGATLNGGTKTIRDGRVLNLGGNSTWSAGTIQLGASSQLNNAASMILDNTFDGTFGPFSGGGGTFNNAGIFTKSAGAGTTSIGSSILGTFNNTGTVNANSGTLSLQTLGGTHTNGAFNVISGATLNFGSGTHTINGTASVTGTGIVSFSGVNGTVNFNAGTYSVAGTTQISGGFIANVNAAAATNLLTLSSGTLGGSATITASGLTTFSGGTMTGAGTTQANGGVSFSGGTKTISGGRNLNLGGNSTWSAGTIQLGAGSQFNNAATMTLDNTFDGTFGPFSGGGGTFNNAGIFTKSAGTGTTSFNSSLVTFNNTGTVNVNSGTLSLAGPVTQHSGTTLTGGTWNVTNGSTLAITSITSGSDIQTNQGNVTLDGAGSTFARFTTALNNNQGSFTLKNNRDLTTAGAFANSGTMRVEDSTTVMTVNGSYTQTAGSTILSNGGTIMLSTDLNLNGGELKGTGTVTGNVITGGTTTIAPGESPGTLTINGNLTLGSGNTLSMEIDGLTPGSLYDLLDVNGVATLAGILQVDLDAIFGSTLTGSETFTLLTSNSLLSGSFSNVASGSRLDVFGGNGSFLVNYSGNDLVLGSYLAVPEPSRMMLALVGLISLTLRRRKAAWA